MAIIISKQIRKRADIVVIPNRKFNEFVIDHILREDLSARTTNTCMVYDNHLDKYKLPIGIAPISIARQILEISILSSRILEEGETLYPAPTFLHVSYREFDAIEKFE